MTARRDLVVDLADVGIDDLGRVGGKNASLGEMTRRLSAVGVRVPEGFATTAEAYRLFITANDLEEAIADRLVSLRENNASLASVGQGIRRLILAGDLPQPLVQAVVTAYADLCRRTGREDLDVAVRSSATAEDLPDASFAGQQETFLNVRGEVGLLDAVKRCFASLFTDRAIAYREQHHFHHLSVALSVGVQRMVRSDRAGAGVMFSIDTETGFPRAAVINAAWGLGETVVQGQVDPDEYVVFKPLVGRPELTPIVGRVIGAKGHKLVYGEAGAGTVLEATTPAEQGGAVLSDAEILELARWAVAVETHYGRPMDMEWAKDGPDGPLYMVQARPETVQARREASALRAYSLAGKGAALVKGLSIGEAAAVGRVCRLDNPAEGDRFPDHGILVTGTTDPDWLPVMRRAAAVVTDHGGRTSHAAIVSRELGLPAVVGCGMATQVLRDGQEVTVSCAEGDTGVVYDGRATVAVTDVQLSDIPRTRTRVMLNMANPAAAFRWWRLPSDGVGLARMEFVINTIIRIHPMALVHPERVEDPAERARIAALTAGYASPADYFVDRLALGIGRIAAAFHPDPVIVRTSDFKTNEYARLIGGRAFEPAEENPMIGWRGASRYYREGYREGFALECRALKRVREEMGFTNLVVMIPFCRSPAEADAVLAEMAAQGLERGVAGLEVYVMCEIPSNVILARRFAERFDGFSIGSNDLTQLTLGVDRDSTLLAALFQEEDEAVTTSIANVIRDAHAMGRKVGLCGQAPSDRPAFARFLVASGIDSISVTPDSFFAVKANVAAAEAEIAAGAASPGTEATVADWSI